MQGKPRPPASIQTDRLLLCAPRLEHAQEVSSAVIETFADLKLWMPWARDLPTLEDTEEHMKTVEAAWSAGEDFAYVAFLKSTNSFVMGTGLHPRDREVPSFEIGYWCRASMQRQGYVTEAVRALADCGLQQLQAQRIEIRCDVRNLASARVAERAGFHLEATLRKHRRSNDGQLSDTLIFSVLAA